MPGNPARKLLGFDLSAPLEPDDVRGDFNTLEQSALAHAWPALGSSRGHFLFLLDETGPKLETCAQGHPSLAGRVMFVNATEGRPEAAATPNLTASHLPRSA